MSTENTEYFFQKYKQNEEKSLELAKLIKKAVKEVRADFAARKECQELCNAQRKTDKDEMWRTLQQNLRDNAQEIMRSEQSLGITLARVDRTFYDNLTITDVRNQIELLIGAIHAIRVNKKQQEIVKECLKKLMKESGLFTKQEIEMVCPERPFR